MGLILEYTKSRNTGFYGFCIGGAEREMKNALGAPPITRWSGRMV
jgi:hypothetical protein